GLERPVEEHKYTSSIGYAVSTDGIHFKRYSVPILVGETSQEMWGVEDPRITLLDGRYYMIYTAFGGRDWFDVRPTIIGSPDLVRWEGRRILLDEPNKDVALFPEKVGGRYVILHRRLPDIWIAFSNDLINWTDHQIIMRPIPGTWQSQRIGIAGPPVRTRHGWLLFYHGVDESRTYRLGAALLDPANPTVVLARQDEPILEPELEWERNGLVPNVVFSCGQAETEDGYLVYYGAADTCIGVAYVSKEDVRF
ncbi:MAG TPA: glycosidase, partial [Firmicutes bacterium]|nr:glycosidase [Bacillota bacterium]